MKQVTRSSRSWVGENRWPLAFAILGTLLRLGLIAAMRRHERFFDEQDYHTIATFLSRGLGFKDGDITTVCHAGNCVLVDHTYFTAYRAPGQLVFMALLYAIVSHLPSVLSSHLPAALIGNSPLLVEIAEALMLAVLPFVCYRLGRALGLSPLAANMGAALAAFHPALAYASTTLYPTALTTTALTLGIWFSWQAIQENRTGRAVAAAIALGIAGAATTTFAPVAFLAAVVIAIKRRFKMAIIVLVIGVLPTLAWMSRNERVLGDFTVATNGGYNLELGANDQATPRSGNWVELTPDWARGEVYNDHLQRAEGAAWIHAHRGRYVELAILRALVVFDSAGRPRTGGVHSNRLAQLAVNVYLLPIMVLSVIGMFFYRKHALAWLTLAALGLVILSSAATIAKPRFRFPCDPLLCVFAIGGAVCIAQRRLTPADTAPEYSTANRV